MTAPDWSLANCLGMDPDLFFDEDRESIAAARAVCQRCEIRDGVDCTHWDEKSPHITSYNRRADAAATAPAHSPNLSERSEPMTHGSPVPVSLPDSVQHGSSLAYRKHGCRCTDCREFMAAAARSRTERREGRKVTPRRFAPPISTWRDHVKEDENGCLVWQWFHDRNGYGRHGGAWAHRAVYEYEVGPIPEGHELDHLCVNPPCVNPAHLDPVTKAEHAARTWRRVGKDDRHFSAAYLRTLGLKYGEIAEVLKYQGAGSAHEAVNAAIRKGLVNADDVPRFEALSEQDCIDIVELRAMGVPVSDLAKWYGIDTGTASRISRGGRTGQDVA